MRLALKFTLAFLLGICVVLGAYAYGISRREISMFEIDLKRDQVVLGYALAVAARQEWERLGEDSALRFIAQANRAEQPNRVSVRWVWLDAPAGSPFHPRCPAAQLAELRQGMRTTWVDEHEGAFGRRFTCVPVLIGGRGMGAVEIGESLEEQTRYVRATVNHILTTTGAAAVLSALLAAVLGFRLVGRPVIRMIERTRAVAAGDLGDRLRFRQHDELRDLADELNAMCDQLAAARDRVAAETAAKIATVEQLRHADRLTTVGRLASGIAHELGTPLNVVRARAKMISSSESAGGDAVGNARIIVEQSDRMTTIIRQLLDFARPRAPQRVQSDLVQVTRETLALLTSIAHKRSVSLVLTEADAPMSARVDRDQLQQVLSNLIMNGIQAMQPGGTLTVEVKQERLRPPADRGGPEGEYISLYVRDQGQGIPPEHLARLFEPFFTTKQIGEGTGLGLSVSRGIINEHGGWISVQSRVGEGSCFGVHLPQEPGDVPSSPSRR